MDDKLLYWLGTIDGLGIKKIDKVLREFSSVKDVFKASEKQLRKVKALSDNDIKKMLNSKDNLDARWEENISKSIGYISYYSEDYPSRLKQIFTPPKHLYYLGKKPCISGKSIAIVGARNCTMYGQEMARLFGYHLSKSGMTVISGMAKGVDGWSHQGALEAGGDTIAVLGSGVKVCYPPVHLRLYRSIIDNGTVLSEYDPYMQAHPGCFPARNRIISGLCDGILIVEAREKSGSLITANAAIEQGKDVFVIPGRIGDTLSEGCNRLIVEGAIPVLSPNDILDYYNIEETRSIDEKLSDIERQILEKTSQIPLNISQICNDIDADFETIFETIIDMKNNNKIEEVTKGIFIAK